MAEKWHLTPDSGTMKGNNPYQLNRTTIDPSFRSTGTNINDIQGYSATGEIIYKTTGEASTANTTSCSTAYKTLEAMRIPTNGVSAANQLPDMSPFPTDTNTSGQESIEGFSSRKRAHHHHRQHGQYKTLANPQAELQRFTQEQYDRIMGQY